MINCDISLLVHSSVLGREMEANIRDKVVAVLSVADGSKGKSKVECELLFKIENAGDIVRVPAQGSQDELMIYTLPKFNLVFYGAIGNLSMFERCVFLQFPMLQYVRCCFLLLVTVGIFTL